jgi:hypothetical protein
MFFPLFLLAFPRRENGAGDKPKLALANDGLLDLDQRDAASSA